MKKEKQNKSQNSNLILVANKDIIYLSSKSKNHYEEDYSDWPVSLVNMSTRVVYFAPRRIGDY